MGNGDATHVLADSIGARTGSVLPQCLAGPDCLQLSGARLAIGKAGFRDFCPKWADGLHGR